MRDLSDQLRAYAEHLDASAPELSELELRRPVPPVRPVAAPAAWRRVAMGFAAAVFVLVVVGVAAFALRTEAPPVTDTTTAPATTLPESRAVPEGFALVGEAPVLALDDGGDGEALHFTGPGGIVSDGGTYHLFVNRYGERVARLAYATSIDLASWQIVQDDLVPSSELAFAEFGVQVTSAILLPDGRWALYFDYETAKGDGDFTTAIGVATAPTPTGPWEVAAASAIDTTEAWSDGGVKHPSVVATVDEVVMFFVAVDEQGTGRIARATSTDGVRWRSDPQPILEPAQEWERGSLTQPNVVRDGARWIMLYAGRTASSHGFAVSSDGIAWESVSAEPVLTVSDVVRPQIRTTELVVAEEGSLWLLVENGGARTTTDIWLLEEVSP